jgi:hypothetical protein
MRRPRASFPARTPATTRISPGSLAPATPRGCTDRAAPSAQPRYQPSGDPASGTRSRASVVRRRLRPCCAAHRDGACAARLEGRREHAETEASAAAMPLDKASVKLLRVWRKAQMTDQLAMGPDWVSSGTRVHSDVRRRCIRSGSRGCFCGWRSMGSCRRSGCTTSAPARPLSRTRPGPTSRPSRRCCGMRRTRARGHLHRRAAGVSGRADRVHDRCGAAAPCGR